MQMSSEELNQEVQNPSWTMDHEDMGMAEIEDQHRKAVMGNSHVTLQSTLDMLETQIDVPLRKMIPMKDIRKPLKTDIHKLNAKYSRGYKTASSCFYLSLKSFRMEQFSVSEANIASWSELWRKEDEEFERRLSANLAFQKYSNNYFYV